MKEEEVRSRHRALLLQLREKTLKVAPVITDNLYPLLSVKGGRMVKYSILQDGFSILLVEHCVTEWACDVVYMCVCSPLHRRGPMLSWSG